MRISDRDLSVQFAGAPPPLPGYVKLDEPITVIHAGDVYRVKVDGPRFDASFPWLRPLPIDHRDSYEREWLFDNDEGVTWLRGHHEDDSPEVKALRVLEAVR